MKRRKFLNLGGLGLLSMHGFSRELSGFFNNTRGQLTETFFQKFSIKSTLDFIDCMESMAYEKAVQSYNKLGYHQNNQVFGSPREFLCFPLQLTAGQTVVDEVILVFKKQQDWMFTGSLQASQLFWFLKNINDIKQEGNEGLVLNVILPESDKRIVENNYAFYQCGLGKIGFSQSMQNGGFSIAGKVVKGGKEVFSSEIIQPELYPEKSLYLSYSNM